MAMSTRLTQVRKWFQGWVPVAAGTCVARVFGAEMTGDPAMLASGCEEDMEVMPERKNRVITHLRKLVSFTRKCGAAAGPK